MSIFKLAWRNVWRNKRRTLATVSAMSLALFVMILYSGLMEGYLVDMERRVLDFEVGDIQVFQGDYRKNPSLYARIKDHDALLKKLDKAKFKSSARLLAAGLAAAGDSSAGVILYGVDPKRDANVSLIYKELSNGQWLDEKIPTEVVIGKRLARVLNVKVGKEIVVLSQGADGSMANELYNVRGILDTVGEAVDRAGIFMTSEAFRELMVVPDGVHQIIVRKPANLELDKAAARMKGIASTLDVKTWRELLPTIASMLDSVRGLITIMFTIVYIAIGIVILNAMLMAVFERIREFGVLKALGMGPGPVLRLILVESAIQTGLALAVGVLFSFPGNWYLAREGIELGNFSAMGITFTSTLRSVVTPGTYVGPIVTLLIIVFLAVLYPAIKAALIRPIRAIHHQ